jgi:hypothetical protein
VEADGVVFEVKTSTFGKGGHLVVLQEPEEIANEVQGENVQKMSKSINLALMAVVRYYRHNCSYCTSMQHPTLLLLIYNSYPHTQL